MKVGKVTDSGYVFPAQPVYVPPESDLVAQLEADPRYVAEPKKNGWRCMVRIKVSGETELWTRNKTVILDPLPNLRKELAELKLPPDSILDGELMEHRTKEVKEQLVLWSFIRMNGRYVSGLPYQEAYAMMKDNVQTSQYISHALQIKKDKMEFYRALLKGDFGPGNEGIVLKNLLAPVPFSWSGEATHRQWFKVKPLVLADGAFKRR